MKKVYSCAAEVWADHKRWELAYADRCAVNRRGLNRSAAIMGVIGVLVIVAGLLLGGG